MTGQGSFWFGSSDFYPETINQSLRFEDGDSPYLDRTPSSASNRDTFTVSFWIKRANLGTIQVLWQQGASNNNSTQMQFYSDNTLRYQHTDSGSATDQLITNAKFRDTTNWYHILLSVDTTQATDTNRVKIYVNGTEQTYSTANYPVQNVDTDVNSTDKMRISGQVSGTLYPFDGYYAEFNLIDGTALDPTSFGETKNDVWIPKSVSGLTYGTNGFRLTFADSSSLGDDTSGNTNDFTSSGLASTDVVLDSPTNNFCTLDPNFRAATANTLSEGGLKSVTSSAGRSFNAGSFLMTPNSGKWYWEFKVDASSGGMGVAKVNGAGAAGANQSVTSTGTGANTTDYYYGETVFDYYQHAIRHNGSLLTSLSGSAPSPLIYGIGVDMDASPPTITYYDGGSSVGSANLDTGFDYIPIAGDGSGAVSRTINVNFGQDDTFAGTETSVGNTDSNGNGLFHDTVPSGYLALCSSNLSDTTLSPNQGEQATDYFNTVLYTGNATDDREVTGVGFKPDWGWFKERDDAVDHLLFDSSRGATEQVKLPSTTAESTQANKQKTFTNDGYTLGTDGQVNGLNDLYVVFNWKANGGTTSTDTNGDVNSTVQVSSDAKFSIVTFTGSASASTAFTVGHGLGSSPKLIMAKQRNLASNWLVYHHQVDSTAPEGYYMLLNTNGAKTASSTAWGNTAPTSTVFTTYTTGIWGTSAEIVAYCFDEVEGYSKFGSYLGNGSTDGTFIYTGFKPAWVIVKRINSGYGWIMNDNKRDPINEVDLILTSNDNGAENGSSTVDFDWLSNGFKCRNTNSNINVNGITHIYMAFAEQPFKFSNAR